MIVGNKADLTPVRFYLSWFYASLTEGAKLRFYSILRNVDWKYIFSTIVRKKILDIPESFLDGPWQKLEGFTLQANHS